jgi:hypothetical protein
MNTHTKPTSNGDFDIDKERHLTSATHDTRARNLDSYLFLHTWEAVVQHKLAAYVRTICCDLDIISGS